MKKYSGQSIRVYRRWLSSKLFDFLVTEIYFTGKYTFQSIKLRPSSNFEVYALLVILKYEVNKHLP